MSQKNKKNSNGCDVKSNVTVVLKADLHCEGCTQKVLRYIRSCEGVESVNIGDAQKISVVGKVDPLKILEKVEKKMRRKVELISPKPDKDKNADKEKGKGKENPKNKGNGGVDGADNKQEKKESESKETKKKDETDEKKKPKNSNKEPPITTAVLKLQLHCEGCTQKIRKIVTKTKGYQDMKIDKQKELVTVTGSSDMKALAEALKKQLKRNVEIVPQKPKEGEKKENGSGENKENNNSEKKENNNNNNKAKKGKDGCENCNNNNGGNGGGGNMGHEGEKKVQHFQQGAYPYPSMYGSGGNVDHQQQQFYYSYNPYPIGYVHAPQLFSDENPNACSVM